MTELSATSPALDNKPKSYFYIRSGIVCSIAFSLGLLFIWLASDCSFLSDRGDKVIGLVALVSFTIQIVAFIPAAIWQTEMFYDLTGSITYFTLAIMSLFVGAKVNFDSNPFDQLKTRQIILTCFVIVWCCRLGSFLFARINNDKCDRRFDRIRDNPPRFFSFWMLQGLWVFLTALPVFTINAFGGPDSPNPDLGPVDFIAWTIWAIGFTIEVISDKQKSIFSARKTGKWIDEGLWYYSRHPNYFGEIVLWTGVFIGCTPIFKGAQWSLICSPLFVLFLLTKVSGIPPTERRADSKWGTERDYILYKKNTQVLLIWFKGNVTVDDDSFKNDLLAGATGNTI